MQNFYEIRGLMIAPSCCLRSCVSVGTKKGYSIINCDPYGKMYSKSESYLFIFLCRIIIIARAMRY